MKSTLFFGLTFMALLFCVPATVEAQNSARRTTTVVKVDRTKGRAVRRKTRKVNRRVNKRVNRRVARRTLRRLPSGTRVVAFRSVNYYPVRGMYYVSRRGVYVRTFPPIGFRVRTLTVAPIRIVVRNRPYWYSEGVFYQKQGEEYEVVDTPVGAVVPELPEDAEEFDFSEVPSYELNNAVYQEVDEGFEIVEILEDQEEEN